MSAAKDKLKVLLVRYSEYALFYSVYGEHAVLSTAATALVLMEQISFEEAFSKSKEMWNSRNLD